MANPLTGNYEAVLQVSLRQVNGILATMHQVKVDPKASPSFPHSERFRVGGLPSSKSVEASRFQNWVGSAVAALGVADAPVEHVREMLASRAPPGVAARFGPAWRELDASVLEPAAPEAAQGYADVQIAAPMIALASGTASEVTVRAWIRARFQPTAGPSLPSPIHGEVQARYVVRPRTLPGGRRVLRVEVTPDDNEIRFITAPGTGLGTADQQAIASQVRTALRTRFRAQDVSLPDDLAFAEFTALGSGATRALVLPLQLSGTAAPMNSLSSVTRNLLGSDGFAIAVSREFLQRFLDSLGDRIRESASSIRIRVSGLLGTAEYTPTVAIHAVAWKQGSIEISGRIDLRTPSRWAPDGWITFTQALGIMLDAPSQTFALQPTAEPQVDESWWLSHARAVNEVKRARDDALPGAGAALGGSFTQARTQLDAALRSFDPTAFARYQAVEITPDGLIARGHITTRGRSNPVVRTEWADGAAAVSAFRSWIPGGRITRFRWSWVEQAQFDGFTIPWAGQVRGQTVEHEFAFPRPAAVDRLSSICLVVGGTRLTATGATEEVEAGRTCSASAHEPILVHPSWWMTLNIPLWLPRPGDVLVADLVAAHVNLMGRARPPGSLTTNVLVHFTGPRLERPLEALAETRLRSARSGSMDRPPSLLHILVLPQGAFRQSRTELETLLGAPGEGFRGDLELAEDDGGWSEAFAALEGPSTYLVDAYGGVVWQQEGRLDPGRISRALEAHAIEAPPPRRVPMRLTVEAGDEALDAWFVDDAGDTHTLRRLRGRPVVLAFWKSWSLPCIRELNHLQQLHEQRTGAMILAVNGGEDGETLARVRERERLGFPLIHDPHQRIAESYGVQCWPTTVFISEAGIVERVRFGLAHDPRETESPARTETSS
jgi:peroxiredoxin